MKFCLFYSVFFFLDFFRSTFYLLSVNDEELDEPVDPDQDSIFAVFANADHPLNIFHSFFSGKTLIDNRYGMGKKLRMFLPLLLEMPAIFEKQRRKNKTILFVFDALFILFLSAISALIPNITFVWDPNALILFSFELMVAGESINFGFSLFKEIHRKRDSIFINLSSLEYHVDWGKNRSDLFYSFLEDAKLYARTENKACFPEFRHTLKAFLKTKKYHPVKEADKRLDETGKDSGFLSNDCFSKDVLVETLAFLSAFVSAFIQGFATSELIKVLVLIVFVSFLFVIVGYWLAYWRFQKILGNYEFAFALVGYIEGNDALFYRSSYCFSADLSSFSQEDLVRLKRDLCGAFSKRGSPCYSRDVVLTSSQIILGLFPWGTQPETEAKIKEILSAFKS